MKEWWLSSLRMTIWAETNNKYTITRTAPIGRKFIGQPLKNLAKWMNKQGGFKWKKLTKK